MNWSDGCLGDSLLSRVALEAQVANCSLVPGCKITMSFSGNEILDIRAEVLEFYFFKFGVNKRCHHIWLLNKDT